MSHFRCEHCDAPCYDTPVGYVTGCKHYPPDAPGTKGYLSCWVCEEINRYVGMGVVVEGTASVPICPECFSSMESFLGDD